MTESRFFDILGRVMSVFGLCVVALLVVYALNELRLADVRSNEPMFTVPPDTAHHKAKTS